MKRKPSDESELTRLSISLERGLARKLEKLCAEAGYTNRSEYLRDTIRARLVEREWELDQEAVGTITIIYDHHAHQLNARLTQIQHDHHAAILATTHVHLDHDRCLEVILVRGRAKRIREIANALKRHKGVLHGDLSMSSTGHSLA